MITLGVLAVSVVLVIFILGNKNGTTKAVDSNSIIAAYQAIEMENEIESAIAKDVFKKKSYPDGYDLNVSPPQKEAQLVMRPYSQKFFDKMKNDLQKSMETVLEKNHHGDFKAIVAAYWNDSNQSELHKEQNQKLDEVMKKFQNENEVEVMSGRSYAATDGHIKRVQLIFYKGKDELKDILKVNEYHKEFSQIASEKEFDLTRVPLIFTQRSDRDWEMKVIPAIDQGLTNASQLPIHSVTLLTEEDPIIVNTTLRSSDDEAGDKAKKIENLMVEFFEIDQIKEEFPGPHEIQVLSKSGQRIN